MAASMSTNGEKFGNVKLGFVEEDDVDWRLLTSKYFPSKVGGKPAWLSLLPIPNPEDLKCDECGDPTIFLMQVYAPLNSRDDAFHRTLFLFVCPRQSCQKKNCANNFKVVRSQLPLINTFYSQDPPNEDIGSDEDVSSYPQASSYQNVCEVCCVNSSKKCGKCKQTFYCSREHQTLDWKFGHKERCGETLSNKNNSSQNCPGLTFEEFELVTEDEVLLKSSDNTKGDAERLEEYNSLMKQSQLKGVDGKYTEDELEKSATAETEDDKQFFKFKARIEPEPKQVLRYSRSGDPLWVSAYNKTSPDNIPPCSCGAKRIFEFQVMPQLLNYLKVDTLEDSLDWGTLCVYTCSNSCSTGNSYLPEFVWKQDFHQSDSIRP